MDLPSSKDVVLKVEYALNRRSCCNDSEFFRNVWKRHLPVLLILLRETSQSFRLHGTLRKALLSAASLCVF
jgi:hypothetical protein